MIIAKELLNSAELHIKSTSYLTAGECQKAMLLFAKLHVTAALKAAGDIGYRMGQDARLTEQQILNSYPLNNIK